MRFPRAVRLVFSRRLLVLVATLGVMASAAASQLGAWFLAVVVTAACLGLARVVRMQAGLHERSLILADDGTCRWDGADSAHVLVVGTSDLGWALWLRCAGSDSGGWPWGRALMLLPDQMSGDDWRALRIWARHKVRPLVEGVSDGRGASPDE